MGKTLRIAGGIALVAMMLTACRYEANYVLKENNTVDATMIFAAAPDEVDAVGIINDATEVGDVAAEYGSAAVSPLGDPNWVGHRIDIVDEPIASFHDPDNMWEIGVERVGSQFVVSGMPIDDPSVWETYRQQANANGDILVIRVTFPGEVYEHNGTLSGRTVVWSLTNYAQTIYARGSAVPPPPAPPEPDPVVTVVIVPDPDPVVTPAVTPSASPSAAPVATGDGDSIPVWVWAVGGGLVLALAGTIGFLVANRKSAVPAPPAAKPKAKAPVKDEPDEDEPDEEEEPEKEKKPSPKKK